MRLLEKLCTSLTSLSSSALALSAVDNEKTCVLGECRCELFDSLACSLVASRGESASADSSPLNLSDGARRSARCAPSIEAVEAWHTASCTPYVLMLRIDIRSIYCSPQGLAFALSLASRKKVSASESQERSICVRCPQKVCVAPQCTSGIGDTLRVWSELGALCGACCMCSSHTWSNSSRIKQRLSVRVCSLDLHSTSF